MPYGHLTDAERDDPVAFLKNHMRWLTGNADRFVLKGLSAGVVSDSITKSVDQWLDAIKLQSESGFDEDAEDAAAGFDAGDLQ